MKNENLSQNFELTNGESEFSYDELEELLESQLAISFEELEILKQEKEKISNPDNLGEIVLEEVWNQFANQIGLDLTDETLVQAYDRKNPDGYTKNVGNSVLQDKSYRDANKQMKQQQREGNLKDEYTGKKLKINDKANLDHVVPRKEIYDNSWRKIADINTKDLANKPENLKATNESLNKSKGAKSNTEYIKGREVREQKLIEQNKRANDKIDKRSGISTVEKKQLKAKNDKKLQDKLDAEDKLMMDSEKSAKKAIYKDIAPKATLNIGKKAGKDALKVMAISSLFALLKEIMNAFIRFLKSKKKSVDSFLEEMKQAIKSFFNKLSSIFEAGAVSFIGSIISEILGAVGQTFVKFTSIIKQAIASVNQAISYLLNPANKNQTVELKIASISKILITGITATGAFFLGETISKFLMTVPGMQIEIPFLGSFANIIGLFFASLTSGLIGAVAINQLDRFISNRLVEENVKKQLEVKNSVLHIQDTQIAVVEGKVAHYRNSILANMSENHRNLQEIVAKLGNDELIETNDYKQKIIENEEYFVNKQTGLKKMQEDLLDLL
ncbi:ABC transporter permease [Streptococcus panodentis]|uniref:Cation diffusion facilitator family transporter n=1 Tax=Streptococcus panodentis TaxID=1581472 RepID=A0ABS5AY13_9STRE|nr:ABC transporter permease [Streptococcus panodentis]MBP2621466.1 hypothetical protein [Streptococcus panodentis]